MSKGFLIGKRIVITGGTGFIGSHLLPKILEQNPSRVLLVSRGSKTYRIKKYLSSIDLKIYRSSREYIKHITEFRPDYLFILGGNSNPRFSVISPESDLEHNFLYNFFLLEELKRIKAKNIRIIFISSVAVYGESKKTPLREDSVTIPKSPYGINKLAMEGYIGFYHEFSNIRGFSIRLFSTYGPALSKQVVYDLVQKLIRNPKVLLVKGDGSEIRDLTYIDDQIEGLLLLARKAKYEGEVYNLGSGIGISISDLALKIVKLMGIKPKIIYQKKDKEKYYGNAWIADISKVKSLKHHPKTSLDEGLKKTIEWIRKL